MRFLTDNDYNTLIRTEIKNILLEDYTPQKLLLGENMAVAQIKNYLKSKYDIDAIFTGYNPLPDPDPRDSYILMITIDCTLYHVYSSIAPNLIPEHRAQRYQDALDWLRQVSKGEVLADLPLLTDGNNQVVSDIRIKSKYAPDNHKW